MTNDMLADLASASVACTVAIGLVLALRWPLRRFFGAALAYQAWSLVPALVAISLLPPLQLAHRPVAVVLLQASAGSLMPGPTPGNMDWGGLVLAGWGLGAAVLALSFWRAHHGFVRSLGVLVPAGGLLYSTSRSAGPALLGLRRPKVVLPADFGERYTSQEQALVIAHEQVHAARRDVLANLAQAAIQCAFWFNPLVHAAALFFRADQEMACDAAVLRQYPCARRAYAEALLKSHSFSIATPVTVACSWRFNHPVKERFMSLKQKQPGASRRGIGRLLVATLVGASAYAGIVARADEAPGRLNYVVSMQVDAGGNKFAPRVVTPSGETFIIEQKGILHAEFVITPASATDRTIQVVANLTDGTGQASHPKLIGKLGEHMRVAIGDKDNQRAEVKLMVEEMAAGAPFPAK